MFVAICLQKSALPQLPALSIYIYYTAQPKTDGGFLEWGYPQSASSSLDHVRIETHGDDWGSLNFNTNTSKLPRIEGKSEISQAQRFAKPFFFCVFCSFSIDQTYLYCWHFLPDIRKNCCPWNHHSCGLDPYVGAVSLGDRVAKSIVHWWIWVVWDPQITR